jgi:hypothetical protein
VEKIVSLILSDFEVYPILWNYGMHTTLYGSVTSSLTQIPAQSPQFIPTLTAEIQNFGNRFLAGSGEDQRWSLAECGLQESAWNKILEWASSCPPGQAPRANSRMGGIVLLMVGAAVSRTLDMEDPLWERVALACSPALRSSLFRVGFYPVQEARDSLSDTCLSLGLRHQLDLPGKHRYWRTVQLQVGFSGKAGVARLWAWLAGFSMPETLKTLLGETGGNGSKEFKRLWWLMHHWSANPENSNIEEELLRNPWYPTESHDAIKAGISAGRRFTGSWAGPVEEAQASTLLSAPRFKGGEFAVCLSDFLPGEVLGSTSPALRLHVEGLGRVLRLIRREDGGRELEGENIRISLWSALQRPSLDVRVVGQSGTIYKERFDLWQDDFDLLLWEERTGRPVRDLSRFQPESGRAYSLIIRSEVRLSTDRGEIDWTVRSEFWTYYSFPHGFPPGLEAKLDGNVLWAPSVYAKATPALDGCSLRLRELSINSLSLEAIAPAGWKIDGFRFCGRHFKGRTARIDISADRKYENRAAHLSVYRDEERLMVTCQSERAGEHVTGAAFQDALGVWHPILQRQILDGGDLEGRLMATSWSEEQTSDPWLTLDSKPLLALPRASRWQRFITCGESLQLRFGLMNEVAAFRITLAPAVYSTGLLAAIIEEPERYLLRLRERVEAIDDFGVWVWESGHSVPLRLNADATAPESGQQGISVTKRGIHKPIAWAIEMEGEWRGARFQAEPHSKDWPIVCEAWFEVLSRETGWYETASALRWWRFPVLMKPFRQPIEAQVRRSGIETFRAWTDLASPASAELSRSALEYYVNPLRTLLWDWRPTTSECLQVWADCEALVTTAFEKGNISTSTALVLSAHPVLLVKVACEILWTYQQQAEAKVPTILVANLFRAAPDPAKIARIEAEYRALFGYAADLVERNAGYGKPPVGMFCHQYLRAEALSELRSWTDARPLDERFFMDHIVRPAEALFDGKLADTNILRVAVSRSRACCAYLVSHLLRSKGLKNGE